jgi:hypothetical protein
MARSLFPAPHPTWGLGPRSPRHTRSRLPRAPQTVVLGHYSRMRAGLRGGAGLRVGAAIPGPAVQRSRAARLFEGPARPTNARILFPLQVGLQACRSGGDGCRRSCEKVRLTRRSWSEGGHVCRPTCENGGPSREFWARARRSAGPRLSRRGGAGRRRQRRAGAAIPTFSPGRSRPDHRRRQIRWTSRSLRVRVGSGCRVRPHTGPPEVRRPSCGAPACAGMR